MKRPGKWLCVDIPSMVYGEAWSLQLEILEARRTHGMPLDVLILLEHPAVFTLGRRGGEQHLSVSQEFVQAKGIEIIQVERGGEITYHGPGQLVGYPIVDLRANGWKVVDFVGALEDVMIRTLEDFGIKASRNTNNRGVWVGEDKIGSVGIAVRGGVSFHGLALNVNTWMEPFQWMQPCGLKDVRMISVERLLGKKVHMDRVRQTMGRHMGEVFGVGLDLIELSALLALMQEGCRDPASSLEASFSSRRIGIRRS